MSRKSGSRWGCGARGPSVATLHRAFRHLDHAAFERALGQWFAAQGLAPDEALAIDGKTLRGIHTALNLLRLAGGTNIAAPLRGHAMYPRQALALLGIQIA